MIFISGPMTGHKDFNYPAFHAVGDFLKSKGIAFRSPAHNLEGEPIDPPKPEEARSWHYYIRESVKLLMDCDSILMLPGWPNSKGAWIEYQIASTLKMPARHWSRMEAWEWEAYAEVMKAENEDYKGEKK